MRDLGRVNSKQIYGLWKNLLVCLLGIMVTLVVSKFLPYYLSPLIALFVASGMYFYVYNTRVTSAKTCIMPVITVLYTIVCYAFLTIILNLMHIWGLFTMPHEFVFFTDPFIPALILSPVGFFVILIFYLRHNKLRACIECRTNRSFGGLRGAGGVLNSEAHFQIKNFILVSGLITLVIWVYYQFFYINVNVNGRDDYIFTWLTVIGLGLDGFYFSIRYYNLYLDLQESNELITQEELRDMTAKTYLRFYVVCGDNMYITEHAVDSGSGTGDLIDTPFFTKQTMNGMTTPEVKRIIGEMTGVDKGELKFFYGRKSPDNDKHSLLRYFYFIDPEDGDGKCQELHTPGEWMSFDKLKYIYSNFPSKMTELAVYDITRLATIMLTEKIFDEEGYRKSGIRSYSPTFNLPEVRKSKIDFQDDKWIRISLFNSDTKLYKLKKWWRSRGTKSHKKIG